MRQAPGELLFHIFGALEVIIILIWSFEIAVVFFMPYFSSHSQIRASVWSG